MSTAADRKRRRQDDRRRLILDAAAAEFAAHGYERATLGGIGERVGLSKASLYYYVKSKEELFVALVERLRRAVSARAAERAGKDADPRARFVALVHAHVEVGSESPEGRLLAENPQLLGTKAGAVARRRYEKSLRELLSEGMAQKQFCEVPLGPAVKIIYSALNTIPLWFDPAGPLTRDELTDSAVRLLMSGIALPRPSSRGKVDGAASRGRSPR